MSTRKLCTESFWVEGADRQCVFYAEHVAEGLPHRVPLPDVVKIEGTNTKVAWRDIPLGTR